MALGPGGRPAALGVLAVLVAGVGVPLVRYVPISGLRVVVGALLLTLGSRGCARPGCRASGRKALHDEDAIYAETVASLRVDGTTARRDAVGFAVAFKGVFLEGTEVVLIVVGLGASGATVALASVAAVAALLVVGVVGAIVARQLSKVPENLIKLVVGIMLTSFGLFWVGEGAGIHWPGSDLFILALVGALVVLTSAVVPWLARSAPAPRPAVTT